MAAGTYIVLLWQNSPSANVFFMASTLTSKKFNWGASVDISMPALGNSEVPPWSDLKFNPLGICNLHHHIGVLAKEHGIFTRYQRWFESADIAWSAVGASQDNDHYLPADTCHQSFDIA